MSSVVWILYPVRECSLQGDDLDYSTYLRVSNYLWFYSQIRGKEGRAIGDKNGVKSNNELLLFSPPYLAACRAVASCLSLLPVVDTAAGLIGSN